MADILRSVVQVSDSHGSAVVRVREALEYMNMGEEARSIDDDEASTLHAKSS